MSSSRLDDHPNGRRVSRKANARLLKLVKGGEALSGEVGPRRGRRRAAAPRVQAKRSARERQLLSQLKAGREEAALKKAVLLGGGRCELCRKPSEDLSKTPCCGRMVCIASFSKGCCAVKHGRFTLCGAHQSEGHAGDWKTCTVCPETWEPEMYVWYGTNKWNFEKLPNPPSYEPTHCVGCGRVVVLSKDAHSYGREGYRCAECWED